MTMILTCEECQTNYVVKAASIPADGRTVKCIKCGHSWHQSQREIEPDAGVLTPEPSPTPGIIAKVSPAKSFPVVITKKSTPILLKLLPLPIMLTSLVAGIVFYKDNIVKILPPFGKFYDMVGLTSSDGIYLDDVHIKKVKQDNYYDLYIKAAIVNGLDDDRPLPPIRITLLDKNKKSLASNTMVDKKTILKSEEDFTLKTKIPRVHKDTEFVILEIGKKWELFVR